MSNGETPANIRLYQAVGQMDNLPPELQLSITRGPREAYWHVKIEGELDSSYYFFYYRHINLTDALNKAYSKFEASRKAPDDQPHL